MPSDSFLWTPVFHMWLPTGGPTSGRWKLETALASASSRAPTPACQAARHTCPRAFLPSPALALQTALGSERNCWSNWAGELQNDCRFFVDLKQVEGSSEQRKKAGI